MMKSNKGRFMKFLFLSLLLFSSAVFAKIKTERVAYEKNGTKMEGYLAWDSAVKKPRPGIVVFPEWFGIGPFSEGKAVELAKMGYVAFAADVYGIDTRPKDMKEAAAAAGKYKADRPLMRERAQAALDTLLARKEVNKDKTAAIGFCFGGTVALELARSGADFDALVSFHGGLNAPVKGTKFAPKILVLHGGDDPYVPEKEVLEFQTEMRQAAADWQFISYGNTVHSFTNPDAGNDPKAGAAYNEVSAKRAMREMKTFFEDTLK